MKTNNYLIGLSILFFVLAVAKAPHVILAFILSFIMGLAVSPIMVISNTLVHELTDNSMRGKVFSSLEVVVHLAFLLAMLVVAPLSDMVGPIKILLGVSFILASVGLIGFLSSHDQARRT